MRQLFMVLAILGATARLIAASWGDGFARMPLGGNVTVLNHTNCVAVVLGAFQADATVKALIFMPGATDELHFFRRVSVAVTNQNPSLLDAVIALTNQSPLRATFRAPFLLLHSDEDVLDLDVTIQHAPTVEKLKLAGPMPRWMFNDRDWDALLDSVKRPLPVGLRPFPRSRASWHFYRHCFAARNLTAWEALEAFALAGKTKFTVRRGVVEFRPDSRLGTVPKLERFPR